MSFKESLPPPPDVEQPQSSRSSSREKARKDSKKGRNRKRSTWRRHNASRSRRSSKVSSSPSSSSISEEMMTSPTSTRFVEGILIGDGGRCCCHCHCCCCRNHGVMGKRTTRPRGGRRSASALVTWRRQGGEVERLRKEMAMKLPPNIQRAGAVSPTQLDTVKSLDQNDWTPESTRGRWAMPSWPAKVFGKAAEYLAVVGVTLLIIYVANNPPKNLNFGIAKPTAKPGSK